MNWIMFVLCVFTSVLVVIISSFQVTVLWFLPPGLPLPWVPGVAGISLKVSALCIVNLYYVEVGCHVVVIDVEERAVVDWTLKDPVEVSSFDTCCCSQARIT